MSRPKPAPPEPDSKRQVSVPSLMQAVRLFREAGDDGLGRDELAKALGKSEYGKYLQSLLEENA